MSRKVFRSYLRNVWTIRSAISLPILTILVANTDLGRRIRFKIKFGGPLASASSPLKNLPHVSQKDLEFDVRYELVETVKWMSGVKVIWAEAGTGKTTTIKRVINELIAEGKIAGCVYLKPSVNESESAHDWFVRASSDVFGHIVHPGDNLSSVLGYTSNVPYAVIIDQFDGSDTLPARSESLIRNFAYDAAACQTYMVFVVTSDKRHAETVSEWNGGCKITYLGAHRPPFLSE